MEEYYGQSYNVTKAYQVRIEVKYVSDNDEDQDGELIYWERKR